MAAPCGGRAEMLPQDNAPVPRANPSDCPAPARKRQRQTPCARAAALALLAASPLCAQPVVVRNAETFRGIHFLESTVPVLSISEASGRVVMGLGRHGMADVELLPGGDLGEPRVREDWPTLSVLELPGDAGVLLGGRDGMLRVVSLRGEEATLKLQWEGEGLPGGLALEGELLAVGGAAAGVTLWQWPDFSAPPRLVGRYPFAGYVKEVEFMGNGLLAAADVYAPGVVLLDIRDPLRPRHDETVSVHTFCDSFAFFPGGIFVADRSLGTAQVPLAGEGEPGRYSPSRAVGVPLAHDTPDAAATAIHHRDGRVAVAEGGDGVRLFHRVDEASPWSEAGRLDTPGNVVDVFILQDGRVAAAAHAAGAFIAPWPQPEPAAQAPQ